MIQHANDPALQRGRINPFPVESTLIRAQHLSYLWALDAHLGDMKYRRSECRYSTGQEGIVDSGMP